MKKPLIQSILVVTLAAISIETQAQVVSGSPMKGSRLLSAMIGSHPDQYNLISLCPTELMFETKEGLQRKQASTRQEIGNFETLVKDYNSLWDETDHRSTKAVAISSGLLAPLVGVLFHLAKNSGPLDRNYAENLKIRFFDRVQPARFHHVIKKEYYSDDMPLEEVSLNPGKEVCVEAEAFFQVLENERQRILEQDLNWDVWSQVKERVTLGIRARQITASLTEIAKLQRQVRQFQFEEIQTELAHRNQSGATQRSETEGVR